MIKLGDKEVEFNTDFKFYITTKLSNPHYQPEISTKTSIVNFAVKEQGLEAQLLGAVVRKERPELEEQVTSEKLIVLPTPVRYGKDYCTSVNIFCLSFHEILAQNK